MAYCGHKKEDIEDTSMNSYWKPARPAPSWNPWGQLPPPQRGGGGEEDEKITKESKDVCSGSTRASIPTLRLFQRILS